MKVTYYKETDSLYIELAEGIASETHEFSDHINIDLDKQGNPVGIDIHAKASQFVNLDELILVKN